MAEIKRKPVFEQIDGKWQLVGLDCPLCDDGILEALRSSEYIKLSGVEYAACDRCCNVVRWNAKQNSPNWRVLQ